MESKVTKELVGRIQQRKLSVLFAEDNAHIRDSMLKSLSLVFNKVTMVEDGKQALEQLDSHHYDLVITDMNMPEGDGVDLIRAIRKKCKIFPIIITTAHFDFVDIYKEQPNIYVISKPYSILEIMEAVDSFEEYGSVLIEDTVYDKLNESYNEAKKVLDLISKTFKGL